jgi:hypothetical protein
LGSSEKSPPELIGQKVLLTDSKRAIKFQKTKLLTIQKIAEKNGTGVAIIFVEK